MAGQLWTHKRRVRREALAALFFLSALGVGLVVYFNDPSAFRAELSITGGSASGLRSQIARRLLAEAKKQGLSLRLRETGGSKEALEQVEQRSIDMAFVQGAIEPSP
jgi:TRAP-type uncharacterized transport system substrate-binding protein